MRIDQVMKLPPERRFLYWMRERHQVFRKREAGLSKPWTDDEILQKYFFTNPYRENDRVTQWFRDTVREPLNVERDRRVLMATVIFRWFNWIPTGEVLIAPGKNLLLDWNEKEAIERLTAIAANGEKVFTGAFIIAARGPNKVRAVCESISKVWEKQDYLIGRCDYRSLETVWNDLCQFPNLGKFMSYEIVCDLRYTFLLDKATDIWTWANPGPGAARGLARLNGGLSNRLGRADQIAEMQKLLTIARTKLPQMPKFEMREIEHSLCEWDKYERALWGDGGKMKRRYPGA